MRRALTGLGIGASGVLLAGCAHAATSAPVAASALPLVPSARVTERLRQCDRGENGFCAIELVVVDRSVRSSGALVTRERRILQEHGWYRGVGDTSLEQAADSPGHRLRVTYATALADLTGVGVGWIKRPRSFALALSREVLSRQPAMSLMLETGPA